MPPKKDKKDKCKKQADCGCGCAKKTKRKRIAKPKNYAGAKMIGFSNIINQPFMAPINPVVPVAPAVAPRRRSPSPTIPTGPSIRMTPRPSAPLPDRLVPFLPAPEGPNIRMAPIPSAPVMEAPRPARYSRVERAPSAIVAPAVPLVEPLGRYGIRSRPADTLQAVGAKPAKEKKKALTTTDVTRPVVADGVDTSGARPLKERKSITVTAPSQVPLSPDLIIDVGRKNKTEKTASPIKPPSQEHLTEKGKGRKLTTSTTTGYEPAEFSHASMAFTLRGRPVHLIKESGGAREGAGRPTEKRPEE